MTRFYGIDSVAIWCSPGRTQSALILGLPGKLAYWRHMTDHEDMTRADRHDGLEEEADAVFSMEQQLDSALTGNGEANCTFPHVFE